jgi:hypothetical protein
VERNVPPLPVPVTITPGEPATYAATPPNTNINEYEHP